MSIGIQVMHPHPENSSRPRSRQRSILRLAAVLLLVTAAPGWSQSFYSGMSTMVPQEQRATLQVQTNGVCLLESDIVMSREMAERTVRMIERLRQMTDMLEDDALSGAASANTATNAQESMSDADLMAKLKELTSDEMMSSDSARGISRVEVEGQGVRLVITNAFDTPDELLGSYEWNQLLWSYPVERMTLETQSNGTLRLALMPYTNPRQTRAFERLYDQWKKAGVQNHLQLIMPGQILSSSLPQSTNHTTSLTLIATNEASLAAFRSLMTTSIVVVAESGGLVLAEPADSNKARMDRYGSREAQYSDLPIQEASPGYMAEADSLEVTTVYTFPAGTNANQNPYLAGLDSAGVEVDGRFFAPKGRTLLSVTRIRVVSVVDDKGRQVVQPEEDESTSYYDSASVSSDKDDPSARMTLRLGLPQPDAAAIEEIAAEAEVVTAGSWKEMEVTNVLGRAGETVDVSELVPGAKLTIVKDKQSQRSSGSISLTLKLEGTREIQAVKVEASSGRPGETRFSTYDSSTRTVGSKSTREVNLHGYSMMGESIENPGSVRVLLKFPKDLRREKVSFKLTGMDLY